MCHNIIKVLQLFLNCLIKDDKKIVVVNTILAGARGDIYKKMGGLK